MRMFALLVLLSVAGAQAQTSGIDLYVSPAGNDGNPGSLERPFRTLERARDAVRAAKAGAERNIVVYLRSGFYSIDRTFTLSAEDSGWPQAPVVYRSFKGERAVISGGVSLKRWTKTDSGLWKTRTTLPDFRQLYVNGRRAIRARGAVPARSRFEGSSAIFIEDARLAQWQNPQDVELVFDVQWERNILKVLKIEPSGSGVLLSMLEPYFTLARMKEGKQIGLPTHIENARELLDEPGEWYLDRSAHEVYYKPRSGENMETIEVIAPALEQLVELKGTLDRPVHDIRFEGITFAYGTWLQPSRIGHVDVQANFTMPQTNLLIRSVAGFSAFGPGPAQLSPVLIHAVRSPANVVLDAAKSIRFERCVFTHLGGAGLDIRNGSQDNLVSGSKFEDIAGTAIQIGDVTDHHPQDPRAVVRNNRVSNCYINDVANQYLAGVGIFGGYTEGTTIAHNEITNLPYSGISIGWGWGETDAGGGGYYQPVVFDTPTVSRNNRVEYNYVHNVMQLLWDGAGIYTLGDMPGTIVRGNHVHDNPGVPGGIYLDEGSARIEVTGNLVYGLKPGGKREAQPMNFNNRRQNRIATCNVHDNHFFANKPEDSGSLRDIAETAGLEQSYRNIK